MDQGNSSCENLLDEKEEIKKQITKKWDEKKEDGKLITSRYILKSIFSQIGFCSHCNELFAHGFDRIDLVSKI